MNELYVSTMCWVLGDEGESARQSSYPNRTFCPRMEVNTNEKCHVNKVKNYDKWCKGKVLGSWTPAEPGDGSPGRPF